MLDNKNGNNVMNDIEDDEIIQFYFSPYDE